MKVSFYAMKCAELVHQVLPTASVCFFLFCLCAHFVTLLDEIVIIVLMVC